MSSGCQNNLLGLLAGTGELPVLVAQAARVRGLRVLAFGFEGMMEPALAAEVAQVFVFPFCRLEALFSQLATEGVKRAVTIGGIPQTSVLTGTPQFDSLALRLWALLPDRRVDSIMKILLSAAAEYEIEIISALDFLSDHLALRGHIAGRPPTPDEWEDIHFGFRMAKAIGRLDIGQTVVVKHRAVMAVEAVEGTDEAIRRGGRLARGGAVVVKTAKPQQDLRFDVPTVGPQTVENMREVGAAVLALEAGQVLMVAKEKIIAAAEEGHLSVVGMAAEESSGDGG